MARAAASAITAGPDPDGRSSGEPASGTDPLAAISATGPETRTPRHVTFPWDLTARRSLRRSTSPNARTKHTRRGKVTVGTGDDKHEPGYRHSRDQLRQHGSGATITTPTPRDRKVGDVTSYGSASDHRTGPGRRGSPGVEYQEQCHSLPHAQVKTFAGGRAVVHGEAHEDHLTGADPDCADSGAGARRASGDPKRQPQFQRRRRPSDRRRQLVRRRHLTRTVSSENNSVSATYPQTGGTAYGLLLSDGGAQTHNLTATATATTYTARRPSGAGCDRPIPAETSHRTWKGPRLRAATSIAKTGAGRRASRARTISVRCKETFNLAAGTQLFEARADDGSGRWNGHVSRWRKVADPPSRRRQSGRRMHT